MQVQKRQELRDLRRAAHVGWHDHALEAPTTLSTLVDPAVVDPWGTDLHGPSPTEDLALPGSPIANDQGVASLIALIPGRVDVGIDLRLQCLGEHPPRSLTGDLVQIEGEFFAGFAILVYPEHNAVSPSHDRRWRAGPLGYLLGKVHRVLREISNPQLLTISRMVLRERLRGSQRS